MPKLEKILRENANNFDDGDGSKEHFEKQVKKESELYKILCSDLQSLFDENKLADLKKDLLHQLKKYKINHPVIDIINKLHYSNIFKAFTLINQTAKIKEDIKIKLIKIFTFYIDGLMAQKLAEIAGKQIRLNNYQKKLDMGYANYTLVYAEIGMKLYQQMEKALLTLEIYLLNPTPQDEKESKKSFTLSTFFSSNKDKSETNTEIQSRQEEDKSAIHFQQSL